MLRDKQEIDWTHDSPILLLKKVIKRLAALPGFTNAIDVVASLEVLHSRYPRLQEWGLEPHMVRGYQRGLGRYGNLKKKGHPSGAYDDSE